MLRLTAVLIACLSFLSCATLMNAPRTAIHLHATQPSQVRVEDSTVNTRNNEATLSVTRSAAPLEIVVTTNDSLTKKIVLRPYSSAAYYSNIIENLGVGMLIDKHNPKRYGYPKNIYLNSSDTSSRYYLHEQDNHQHRLYIQLAFPWVNSFYMKPVGETFKANTGFLGGSLGLNYFYQSNRFISLYAGASADVLVPVPAPVHREGEWEQMTSTYVVLANIHVAKQFRWGYGLSLSKNNWSFFADSVGMLPPSRESVVKSHYTAGLAFPLQYQFAKRFYCGFLYRPGLLNISNGTAFRYEHLLSLEFGWRFRIR